MYGVDKFGTPDSSAICSTNFVIRRARHINCRREGRSFRRDFAALRTRSCPSHSRRAASSFGLGGISSVVHSRLAASVAAVLLAPVTHAQRVDENAMTAAADAFGTVVGTLTIGLYSPTSARGFNPSQAENHRIEGFYYDQQPQSSNPYLVSGSDLRVGIAAQSYAVPSPSGIADYHLRIPDYAASASAVLTRGPLRRGGQQRGRRAACGCERGPLDVGGV